MMVHRLLQHYLDQGNPVSKPDYEKNCRHASDMEKTASDAERASIKYKQVEFMQKMLGEAFEGIVTGVTEWGIYVEITQTKCEGMVKLSDLDDDYYVFDESNFRVIGNNTGRTVTLGDQVKVRVARTDINRRLIDLDLIDS
jgi:ribonuclease R